MTAASQQGVLDELRRAFELQKLLALNADTWPAVQRQVRCKACLGGCTSAGAVLMGAGPP